MNIITDTIGISPVLAIVLISSLMFIEASLAVGLLLPGASAVLLLGTVTQSGCLSYFLTSLSVGLASTVGAQLAFVRASRRREAVEDDGGRRRPGMMRSVCASFANHFFGGIRTLSPRLLAGDGMSYLAFAVANTIAASLWATALITIGRYSARLSWLLEIGSVVVLPLVLALLIWQGKNLLGRYGLTYRSVLTRMLNNPWEIFGGAVDHVRRAPKNWRAFI